MVDIFARLEKNAGGPIGQYMRVAHGYFAFRSSKENWGRTCVSAGR